MHVAVIGGTNHVGPFIVRELVEAGHQVSVYNRGLTKADLPEEVERVVVDRKVRGQLGEALSKRKPDAVIDMVAFVVEDVEEVVRALPSLGHYVFAGVRSSMGSSAIRRPPKRRRSSLIADTATVKWRANSSCWNKSAKTGSVSPVCAWPIPTDRETICST